MTAGGRSQPPAALPDRTSPAPASPSPLRVILFVLTLFPAAVELIRWGIYIHRPGYTDFGGYYLDASVGLHHGWSMLYNLAVEQHEWQALGGIAVLPFYPMIYPPPLAWLATPFALVPLRVGFAIWATLILALFLWIWSVTALGSRLTRWTYLAAALGVFPVAFGLMMGQIVIVSLGAVIAAWWFLGRRQELVAGLVLILIIVKPQVAFLVPIALLVTGYWRTVGVWAAGTALVAILAVLSIGPEGVHVYLSRLHDASTGSSEYLVLTTMTVSGLLGRGLAGLLGQVAVSALTMVAAYRQRRHGPVAAVVAGLVGSLLVTPYVHMPDLTVLFAAAWLYLRMNPPRLPRMVLVVGYVAMLPSVLYRGLQGMEPGMAILAMVWLILIAWPLDLRRANPVSRPARLAA